MTALLTNRVNIWTKNDCLKLGVPYKFHCL